MKFTYASGTRPLDGYTIKRGIGIGGFGEVYFALNDAGKEVALKKIQRNLDIELRGVRQCMNLKHVNLISLWDIRRNEHDESWVVMEYVPGPSLRDLVDSHPTGMPEDLLKLWFSSTASGVSYLHEHGIVHRDLKPGNIFCDQHEQVVKIGDYGLSKFISCSRRSGHTESVGTFHYMAPEIGKGVYGKEIDIYALGIILFEMLTGSVPFEGESTQEIIMKHLTAPPILDGVPPGFQNVIAKALQKDPESRYRSVHELVAELPWPELANNSHTIVSQNSVGRIHLPGSSATAESLSQIAQSVRGLEPEHLTVGHDRPRQFPAASDPGSSVPSASVPTSAADNHLHKLPPIIISGDQIDPGIAFGQLHDRSVHASVSRSPAAAEAPIRVLQYRGSDYAPASELAPPNSQASAGQAIGTDEPIAQVVGTWIASFNDWFERANLSTPVKLGLLIIVGIVVINNASWLLPLTLASTAGYLSYVIGRSAWLRRNNRSPKSHYISPAEQLRAENSQLRHWLAHQPLPDRLTEITGSLLVAALAAIVLNLLGLAINGGVLERSLDTWANYAWLTTLCMVASWILILPSKAWEYREGHDWPRRFLLSAAGLLFGGVAFYSASGLNVDLAAMAFDDFAAVGTGRFVFDRIPMLVAFVLFFGGLFFSQKWWRQIDSLRMTRLSLVGVAAALIYATVACHLLNIPLLAACKVAVIISVSTQLASPWLSTSAREQILTSEICLDAMPTIADDALS